MERSGVASEAGTRKQESSAVDSTEGSGMTEPHITAGSAIEEYSGIESGESKKRGGVETNQTERIAGESEAAEETNEMEKSAGASEAGTKKQELSAGGNTGASGVTEAENRVGLRKEENSGTQSEEWTNTESGETGEMETSATLSETLSKEEESSVGENTEASGVTQGQIAACLTREENIGKEREGSTNTGGAKQMRWRQVQQAAKQTKEQQWLAGGNTGVSG